MPKKYISIIKKGNDSIYVKDSEAREILSQVTDTATIAECEAAAQELT